MNARQLGEDMLMVLKDNAKALGVELEGDRDELVAYLEARLPQVALAVSEPGFMEVLQVEANSLMLKAGLMAVNRADAIDERMKDIAYGALNMAIRTAATGGF